jgi:membrane protease YdiL (CAAX protease family)
MSKTILLFFCLTFLYSWTIWILSGLYFPESDILVLAGAWGPTLAGLLLAFKSGGTDEVKSLLRRYLIWRHPLRYYFLAIFGILLIGLVSVGIHFLATDDVPSIAMLVSGLGLEPSDGILIFLLTPVLYLINTLVGGPVAEELGWRGFAQTKLSASIGPIFSGLIIGFIWAFWHLPLFYFMPSAVAGLPLPEYVILLTAMGVLFAYLHHLSRGSVLVAIIFHGSFNFTVGILGAEALEDLSLLRVFVGITVATAIFLSIHFKKSRIKNNSTSSLKSTL